jgi:hypothetical protein
MPVQIPRTQYAAMYGPTTGDRLRLADTDLIIEVERDLTIYGEEVKFGGGKTIRDGMGQSQVTRAGGAVDTVITNALIVDHSGIYKADVALKDGLIHAIARLAILTPSQALISSAARAPRSLQARDVFLRRGGWTATSTLFAPSRWKIHYTQA